MTMVAHGNSSAERLVIFGCGYVGAAMARYAVNRGIAVTALTRNPTTAADLRSAGVNVIVADLADDVWHSQIMGGPAFALNCVGSGGSGLHGYRHSYVDGMNSILRWCSRNGPIGTYVYTGSTSVYPQDGGVLV